MPTWRIKSATGNPSSVCFKIATICSTENRFLFMADLPFQLQEIRQKTNINHGPLYSGHLSFLTPLFGRARPWHESSYGVAVLPSDWDDAAKNEARLKTKQCVGSRLNPLLPVGSGWCSACQPRRGTKSEIR
jgi:hypothetical protein